MPRNFRNLSLIIGLSIPVFMVIFIGLAINAPRWFSNTEPPRFDFLYIVGPPYNADLYQVDNGRLIQKPPPEDRPTQPDTGQVRLFVHDVSNNRSREVSFEEAGALQLDPSIRSPDGFTVSQGRGGGWFVFGIGGDYNRRYIVKDDFGQRLELLTDTTGTSGSWAG